MLRIVRLWIFGAIAGAALIALAGCGHNFYDGEREAWRREAELACLNSGAIKESPARVRISAISGPGVAGAAVPRGVRRGGGGGPPGSPGGAGPPPAALSSGSAPQHWPVVQSSTVPPSARSGPAPEYEPPSAAAPQGRPSPTAPAQ